MIRLVSVVLSESPSSHANSSRFVSSPADTVNFLGISIVGQTNEEGAGGIYVGSVMKG